MNVFYSLIRTLHLYFGLIVSPFILIFSLSVLVLNHSDFLNRIIPIKTLPEIKTSLDKIPFDTTDLGIAKAIKSQLGIDGEISFISKNSDRIIFPVNQPGLKTRVEVNTNTKNVIITQQDEGSLRGLVYLHIMPGPHNLSISGNSFFIKIWRQIADTVVYLLLFLTASGIFLWFILRSERKPGIYALTLGIFIFTALMFLIF